MGEVSALEDTYRNNNDNDNLSDTIKIRKSALNIQDQTNETANDGEDKPVFEKKSGWDNNFGDGFGKASDFIEEKEQPFTT